MMDDSFNSAIETLHFYNGEVTLYYDDALHAYYTIEGGQKLLCPGCTTVTGMIDKSGPLTQWAANQTVEYARNHVKVVSRYIDLDGLSGDFVNLTDLEPILEKARFNYRTTQKTAQDIGKLAHLWLECHTKSLMRALTVGDLPDTVNLPVIEDGSKAQNCVNAALDWFGKHKFKPLQAERKIYSRQYGYAGTFDWLAYVTPCGDLSCCPLEMGSGEVLALGDFKSSKSIYDEYRAQLAAYQAAWEEEFPDQPIDCRIILHLGKDDGQFNAKVLTGFNQFSTDFDGFLGALATYNWLKQLELDRKAAKPPTKRRAPRRVVVKEPEAIPIGV